MKRNILFFLPSAAARALLFVIISSFFIVGASFAPALVYAAGSTAVSGEISTDMLWNKAGSPYVISGMVTVDVGATLTIAPGVVVKFASNAALTVNGALVATSTTASPIYFTSVADDTVGGDSNGDKSASAPSPADSWSIAFINASPSNITNAVMRYSRGGIFALNTSLAVASTSFSHMNGQVALDGSTFNAYNITFSDMSRGALSIYGSSTARVSGVVVSSSATDAVVVYQNSVLSADNVTVTEESKGGGLTVFNSATAYCDKCLFSRIDNNSGPSVAVYSGSTLSLTNSDIRNATGTSATALEIYDPAWNNPSLERHSQAIISNSVFEGGINGVVAFGPVTLTLADATVSGFSNDGVQAYSGATLAVQTTTFTKNQNAGIEVWGDINGSIVDSYIMGNSLYGILSRATTPLGAAHNWWGSASGPYHPTLNVGGTGNAVSDDVAFSPWLTSRSLRITQKKPTNGSGGQPIAQACCSSVLFIPGLEASRLYATSSTLLGSLTGSVTENQLWEPGLNSQNDQLFLDKNGSSIRSIYTKDVIKTSNEVASNQDIYQHFTDMLDGLARSGTIAAWQAYPYDWRLDPESIVADGTRLADVLAKLEPTVLALAGASKTGKVTIVAHSNGGILAKLLLSKLQVDGKSALVDTLAMVAVPQLGTSLAIPALLSGYGQSLGWGWLLGESTAQQLAQNMPSAYMMLPSAAYFSAMGPAVLFDASLDAISNLHKIYGSAITTVTAMENFLAGSADHRIGNQPLLAMANNLLITNAYAEHLTLNAWQAPKGIFVVQIGGVGLNTLSASRYYARQINPLELPVLDMEPQFTSLGDTTVVAASATADQSATSYYVDLAGYNGFANENRGHADILEAEPAEKLLSAIIQKTNLKLSVLPRFISTSIPEIYKTNSGAMEEISVHSPVALDIYDNQGHHTGLTASGVQNQIPNSYYLPFGEGKYAGVPADTMGKVVLSGEAAGTFTLDITKGGAKTEFTDIPVLPVSMATFDLSSTAPMLRVDFDGDGTTDEIISSATSSSLTTHITSLKKITALFGLPDPAKAGQKIDLDDILAKIKLFTRLSVLKRQDCVAALRAMWNELSKAEGR